METSPPHPLYPQVYAHSGGYLFNNITKKILVEMDIGEEKLGKL